MNEQRIKKLMTELLAELENSNDVDQETVSRARQLTSDIHDLVDPAAVSPENTVMDDAIALEASFAARHPMAEKILRELINNLSKIGI